MSLNMSGRATTDLPTRTAGQWLSLVLGAAFVLAGIAGFFVTGFSDWTGHDHGRLLGFTINPLHNLVHVVGGALGLLAWTKPGLARAYGVFLLVAYGAVLFQGIASADDPAMDVLSLNQADNVLHGVTAVAGLVIALVPTRTPRRPSTAELA